VLPEYMEPDAYSGSGGAYHVNTLYYDTPQNELIHTAMMKPKYREKLRIRSYGVPALNTVVYSEIKKKAAGVGNKRRSAMRLEDAYCFMETGNLPLVQPYMNRQVLLEIQHMLDRYKLSLAPSLVLGYERTALHGREQKDLRISFDTGLWARRENLRLEEDCGGDLIFDPDTVIMEVKVLSSMPLWLVRILSENRLYARQASKYGTVYRRELEKNLAGSGYLVG